MVLSGHEEFIAQSVLAQSGQSFLEYLPGKELQVFGKGRQNCPLSAQFFFSPFNVKMPPRSKTEANLFGNGFLFSRSCSSSGLFNGMKKPRWFCRNFVFKYKLIFVSDMVLVHGLSLYRDVSAAVLRPRPPGDDHRHHSPLLFCTFASLH